MEKGGLQIIKGVMVFINVLVLICGLTLLGLGIWVYANGDSFREIVSSEPAIFNSVAVFIVIGGILIVSGFFGCFGAIREQKCLLGTYFVILALIFLIEVVVVILIFVYYPKAREAAIESTQVNGTAESTQYAWDIVQSTFQCCGFTNASDWKSALPHSCCRYANSTNPCILQAAYPKGCESAVRQYFWILGGVGIGVLALEVLAMVFTCCLYRGIAGSYEFA